MKRGFAFIAVALVIGGLIIVGSGILTARVFFNKDSSKNSGITSGDEQENNLPEKEAGANGQNKLNPTSQDKDPASAPTLGSLATPTVYTQPKNLYTITLPKGWTQNLTTAVNNYSTTKFTGPEGNISITIGAGKDPIGGCSEASSIKLADRTISGCFLLQKDGSKILTRGYTKTKSGLEITTEAYANSPNALNLPEILASVKTIDIN